MAIGRKNNFDDGSKLLILKIVTKAPDPLDKQKTIPLIPAMFRISEKVGDVWVIREKLEKDVSGNLVGIEFKKDSYQGESYDLIKIRLRDPEANESYILDLRTSMITRNLFNSLLDLTSYDNLLISLYKREDRKNPGTFYTNICLRQGDELIRGKFTNDQVPKAEEIVDSKGRLVKRDYTDIDNFFLNHLAILAKALKSVPVKTATEKKVSKVKEKTEAVPVEPEGGEPPDDINF